MRSWYENEELLRRFREWLGRTEAEIAALGLAGQFEDARAENLPDVGIIQLIEAFTALRQEIKLQTKSSRGLEDVVHEAIDGLNEAAEQMRSVDAREADAVARAARPLVEALIELDEALERGLRAAQTAHANVLEDTVRRYEEAAQQRLRRLSFWQRRKARTWFDASTELFREQMADLHRRIMLPLLEGYQLIYQRLERTLPQLEIQRIPCLGFPVDPTLMTVVELVEDPMVEPETVVEVVRPGYQWLGRLIRYAEVRAARPGIASPDEEDLEEEYEDEYDGDDEYEYEGEDEYEDERDEELQDEEELAQEAAEELPVEEPEHDVALLDVYEPQHDEVMQSAEPLPVEEPPHEEVPPRDEELQVEEELPQAAAEEEEEERPSEAPQHDETPLDTYEPQRVEIMPYREPLSVDEPQGDGTPPRDEESQVEEELPQEVAEEPTDEAPQHDETPLDAHESQRVEIMPYQEPLSVDEPQREETPPRDEELQVEEELPQEVAEVPTDEAPQRDEAPLDAYESQRAEIMPYREPLSVDEPQRDETPPRDEDSSSIAGQDVPGQPEPWEAIFWEQTVYLGQQDYPQPALYWEQEDPVPDDGTDIRPVPDAPPHHRDN